MYNANPETVLGDNYQPTSVDVVCGRGRSSINQVGNQRFRTLVHAHLEGYETAPTRFEKTMVIVGIVKAIRAGGGRFLKKICSADSGRLVWIDIGDKAAREKVGHALRDATAAGKQQQHQEQQQQKTKRVKKDIGSATGIHVPITAVAPQTSELPAVANTMPFQTPSMPMSTPPPPALNQSPSLDQLQLGGSPTALGTLSGPIPIQTTPMVAKKFPSAPMVTPSPPAERKTLRGTRCNLFSNKISPSASPSPLRLYCDSSTDGREWEGMFSNTTSLPSPPLCPPLVGTETEGEPTSFSSMGQIPQNSAYEPYPLKPQGSFGLYPSTTSAHESFSSSFSPMDQSVMHTHRRPTLSNISRIHSFPVPSSAFDDDDNDDDDVGEDDIDQSFPFPLEEVFNEFEEQVLEKIAANSRVRESREISYRGLNDSPLTALD